MAPHTGSGGRRLCRAPRWWGLGARPRQRAAGGGVIIPAVQGDRAAWRFACDMANNQACSGAMVCADTCGPGLQAEAAAPRMRLVEISQLG